MVTFPVLGFKRPDKRCNNVVLPFPEVPVINKPCEALQDKEGNEKVCFLSYEKVRLFTEIIFSVLND